MSTLSLIASVLLGVVFVVAGASKLAARESWRVSAVDLGAPPWTFAILPWIELCVGAALIAQLAEPVAALAAIAVLIVFTVLISVRLSQGRRPSCACFGAWSATPIGARHLARNALLIVLGLLALYP
jgi:uncharacterized membrane protein YphA (DoxX/SURF4 family)